MTRQRFRPARMGTIAAIAAMGLAAYLAVPAGASPADHRPPQEADQLSVADALARGASPAPACVHAKERQDFWGKYTDVDNLCGFSVRVKVIVAWGFDSGCHHLWEGKGFTHSYGHAGNFDGLVNC